MIIRLPNFRPLVGYGLAAISAATLALTVGCANFNATVDRWAASDISIVEAATTIERLSEIEIDMTDPDDRFRLYSSLDAYREYVRGGREGERVFLLAINEIWAER